jgi:Na+/glutamate symporter
MYSTIMLSSLPAALTIGVPRAIQSYNVGTVASPISLSGGHALGAGVAELAQERLRDEQ